MATFISFRQFVAENPTACMLKPLTGRLYQKNHKDGTTEDVQGIALCDKNGYEICCLALAKSLSNESVANIAKMAGSLQVASQDYISNDGNERTMHTLCRNAHELDDSQAVMLSF